MPDQGIKGATGFQIALFVFAVLILITAADKFLFSQWQWSKQQGFPIGRTMIFVCAGAILLCFPPLRRLSFSLLSTAVQPTKRKEVARAVALQVMAAFGAIGAFALWWWATGGEPALARHLGQGKTVAEEWRRALSVGGIVTTFILAGILAPIVEELVFRGMLYPAWTKRWGWLPSAIATSVIFAVFHPLMVSQFFGSMFLICLLRRTGSLQACIFAHSAFNIMMWYPFVGQFLFPAGRETGELSLWTPHLICLAITSVAVPVYMWMSRDAKAALASIAPEAASARS